MYNSFWDPVNCSPPGSSVIRNFPVAAILEQAAIFTFRDLPDLGLNTPLLGLQYQSQILYHMHWGRASLVFTGRILPLGNVGDPGSIPWARWEYPLRRIGYPLIFLASCGSASKESACNVGNWVWIPVKDILPRLGNSYPPSILAWLWLMNCIVHRAAFDILEVTFTLVSFTWEVLSWTSEDLWMMVRWNHIKVKDLSVGFLNAVSNHKVPYSLVVYSFCMIAKRML